MVACAVLVESGWSLADAYRIVRTKRPVTAMSEAQLQVLRTIKASNDAPQPLTMQG